VVRRNQSSSNWSGTQKDRGDANKKTYGYKERDELKRQEFLAYLKTKHPNTLVYVDESGIDNTEEYGYGWNEKKQRFHALKAGKRSIRVRISGALSQKQLIAPLTFVGSCNHQVFEKWLEEMLLPTLLPGQTIILDNATFHKSERIRKLIEDVDCELKYLQPYFPERVGDRTSMVSD